MRMPGWTLPLQPALGGAAIGGIIIFFPQVMGVGYEYVDQALNGGLVLKTLMILCAVKLIATIVSYASGNAGGIFAPSLYFGAMAGGAVGVVVHRFAPFPSGDVGAYALVGMGVLFAGIIRAPMTSVFMIFELTQDYQILVPLMIANMLSFLISKHYLPHPVYHALLEQSHVYLPGPESRLSTSTWRAKDIMSREVQMIDPSTPAQEALRMVNGTRSLLVGAAYELQGIISRPALEEAVAKGDGQKPVSELADTHWAQVHPDHPLEFTLERFSQKQGILPVIRRGDGRRIEGVITRESIMQFVDRDSPPDGVA
jgi:CIC family chloride channel protein